MKVFALLKERGDGTRVSLRSNPGVDVSAIATRFGGGGHKQAAGCTIPSIGEAAEQELLAGDRAGARPIGRGCRGSGAGFGIAGCLDAHDRRSAGDR